MGKPARHTNARRRQYIQLIHNTDQYWVDVLGDSLFHDLNYYDLFTQMWLRLNSAPHHAFRKSELYQLMPKVSQRTAVKYVQIAIDHGLLVEHVNPDDLRSRRITMSKDRAFSGLFHFGIRDVYPRGLAGSPSGG
jgi:hypothetical protein